MHLHGVNANRITSFYRNHLSVKHDLANATRDSPYLGPMVVPLIG